VEINVKDKLCTITYVDTRSVSVRIDDYPKDSYSFRKSMLKKCTMAVKEVYDRHDISSLVTALAASL
jgi:hypothetical protein